MLRYGYVPIIMHPSTSKAKEASTTPIAYASVSLNQEPGDAAQVTVMKRKPQKHQKRRHDPSDLLLFSDPLDGTSSDEQSFNEEDMFGSDSDAETISLGFKSNDKKQSFDDQVVCIIIYFRLPGPRTLTLDTGWQSHTPI
jgi:hypothetical protein